MRSVELPRAPRMTCPPWSVRLTSVRLTRLLVIRWVRVAMAGMVEVCDRMGNPLYGEGLRPFAESMLLLLCFRGLFDWGRICSAGACDNVDWVI